MKQLFSVVALAEVREPYSNTIITIIAILTVYQLIRDIYNNNNSKK